MARNQARRIASTVRATLAIPGVDLVLVVDDGSTDNTQELARKAGAVVVRQSHPRGRASSLETGAAVIAMRDESGYRPRSILVLPGSLGNYAIGATALVEAVRADVTDLAIGLTDGGAVAQGMAANAARAAIERITNWSAAQPLSVIRCLNRDAWEASLPLARGAGVEAGMTLDVIEAGLRVTEVECEIRHKASRVADKSLGRKTRQYRDVMLAVSARRVRTILKRNPREGDTRAS